MIIKLDASTAELKILDRKRLSHVVSELLRVERDGVHFLIFSREVCEWCGQELDLNKREKDLLKHLKQRYTQVKSLDENVKISVKIKPSDQDPVFCSQGFIEVGIVHKKLECLFREVCVIVEDEMSDGKFYKTVFEALRKRWRYDGLGYEIRHAGGSRIPDIVAGRVQENRVVVAIVDSEKRAPHETIADDAERVCEILRRAVFGCGFPTLGVEMENYIPFAFLRELKTKRVKGTEELLEKLFGVPSDTWRYFDIKKGISLKRIEDQRTSRWWKTKFDFACAACGIMNTVEVSGFGNVIQMFMRNHELQARFVNYVRIGELPRDEEEQFRSMISFLIASKRHATR